MQRRKKKNYFLWNNNKLFANIRILFNERAAIACPNKYWTQAKVIKKQKKKKKKIKKQNQKQKNK